MNKKDPIENDLKLMRSIINKGRSELLKEMKVLSDDKIDVVCNKIRSIIFDESLLPLSQKEFKLAKEIISVGTQEQTKAMSVADDRESNDNTARGMKMIKLIEKRVV